MSRFKKQKFSGICICGHTFDQHHLGIVANAEAFEIMGGYYAQECEAYGFNEMGGLGPGGVDHCHHYIDKDDKERIKNWNERKAKYEQIQSDKG